MINITPCFSIITAHALIIIPSGFFIRREDAVSNSFLYTARTLSDVILAFVNLLLILFFNPASCIS